MKCLILAFTVFSVHNDRCQMGFSTHSTKHISSTSTLIPNVCIYENKVANVYAGEHFVLWLLTLQLHRSLHLQPTNHKQEAAVTCTVTYKLVHVIGTMLLTWSLNIQQDHCCQYDKLKPDMNLAWPTLGIVVSVLKHYASFNKRLICVILSFLF